MRWLSDHRLSLYLMEEKRTTRLCVPVCVKHAREIEPAVARASEYGDFIELRLDCLTGGDLHDVQYELATMFQQARHSPIFTLRPAEQGGHRELSFKARLGFGVTVLRELLQANVNYADVEVDVGQALTYAEKYLTPIPWDRVICSHHDLIGIPTDLEEIYQKLIATKARILKIAVQADDITDCIPVLHLLERARVQGREMIAIAMGEAGILTRILGPSRGAFLTYGSVDEEQKTASGQIRASELRDLYRIRSIDEQTEIFGLVGNPVIHSMSPQIHNRSFAATDLNAVYIPFEVRDLDGFIRRMVQMRTREIDWSLRGLSITAPHKSAIMQYLDWIDPMAVEIGAVNTVVIADEGLYGYNTDAQAFIAPLNGLTDLDGARVAVIGAGGAARSLLWSLRKSGARATVFARDVERVKPTTRQFGAECTTLDGATFREFDIVVNATLLGTRGLSEDASVAIASQLRGPGIAYDLVYNPIETRFMREASEAGCKTIGGLQMLVAQAAEQFRIWTGKDAPLGVMRDAALGALMK